MPHKDPEVRKQYVREHKRKQYLANKELYKKRTWLWKLNNAEKRRAHGRVYYALKTGRIKPEPCYSCGNNEKTHAHHEDYTRPFEIKWLCATCHVRVHKGRLWL